MPLTRIVRFKTRVQEGNRLQVPKVVRWEFKLEPSQTLLVRLMVKCGLVTEQQSFYSHISKDGRLVVPIVIRMSLLKSRKMDLVGEVVDVVLEPVS